MNTRVHRVDTSRRTASTERGRLAQERILEAARRLLEADWIDRVPLSRLTEACGLARASILLQYPAGWPDILTDLAVREFDYVDPHWAEALAMTRAGPVERVWKVVAPMFDRAAASGLLYANIRGAMFTWGAESQATFRCGLQDYVQMIAECLVHPVRPEAGGDSDRLYVVAESLYYQALDLVAGPWYTAEDWAERATAFRSLVDIAAAGLASSPRRSPGRVKS